MFDSFPFTFRIEPLSLGNLEYDINTDSGAGKDEFCSNQVNWPQATIKKKKNMDKNHKSIYLFNF